MKVIREITYECDDEGIMLHQLKTSLADGEHNFGKKKVTVRTIGDVLIEGCHLMGQRGLSHDKSE